MGKKRRISGRSGEEYAKSQFSYTPHEFPYVTEDGMQWRDAVTGEAPLLDDHGKLTKPFCIELVTGARETWAPGMTIPLTPDAVDQKLAAIVAARPKIKKTDN